MNAPLSHLRITNDITGLNEKRMSQISQDLLDGEFNSNLEAYPEMNRYLGNP